MPQTNKKQRVIVNEDSKRTMRPALTPEAEENQMISLAIDLAKRQLLDGTASSQVITHFLQLGSSKRRLETEMMEQQKELIQAKTEAIKSAKSVEELYNKAIKAMKVYSGEEESREQEDENNNYY